MKNLSSELTSRGKPGRIFFLDFLLLQVNPFLLELLINLQTISIVEILALLHPVLVKILLLETYRGDEIMAFQESFNEIFKDTIHNYPLIWSKLRFFMLIN